MIYVLSTRSTLNEGGIIAHELKELYGENLEIELIDPEVEPKLGDPNWDDVLVVVYDDPAMQVFDGLISQFRALGGSHQSRILPVATRADDRKPPNKIQAIKAIAFYENTDVSIALALNTIGIWIGQRIRSSEKKIFISYRATDGTKIANQLFQDLTDHGYDCFLDEAVQSDGDRMIRAGEDVQKEIEQHLEAANMLLLVDTPEANQSEWIQHELRWAQANLIPVFALVVDDLGKLGPRFSILGSARCLSVETSSQTPLRDADLDQLRRRVYGYLVAIAKRKLLVAERARQEFEREGFAWSSLDKRKYLFHAKRERGLRSRVAGLAHCSYLDVKYLPGINAGINLLLTNPDSATSNFRLLIYDGPVLPEAELRSVMDQVKEAEGADIYHHQELELFLSKWSGQ